MINKTIDWSIQNRALVLILTALLIAVGWYCVSNTPVDAIPDLSDVQVIVKTSFPGQAPQVVEDQVTYPLTTAMLAVPKATTVRGYSFFGDSYVYILFEDGTDLYWARSRVLEYLSQVLSKLPKTAKPELGPDATGVGWVYSYALVDRSGKHDLSELTTLQNWFLKFELIAVPGVAEVATVGGMVKQYQITLDPTQMRAYNLSLNQLKRALAAGNQEVGGSVIEMAEAEYMVRSKGYIKSLDDIKNIHVGVTAQGTPILLSNVSRVEFGPKMRRGIAELDGQGEVVGGIIVLRQGEDAQKTINLVKEKLHKLQKSLPEGVRIVETYDRSSLIQRAIRTLQSTLVQEIIIVILICLVFLLHFRSSLVVAISLPIGIIGAFIIMYFQGISSNIMSLGGIALAIGTMVDAAIVMIENLHKHIEQTTLTDKNRWQIVAESTKSLGKPIFFSLLIITLSFLPVFTLQAQEGRLFSPLAFTKTYAMGVSAILSITLVPVLMGFFVRGRIRPEGFNPINRTLRRILEPLMRLIMNYPLHILLLGGLFILCTLWPLSQLGTEFMPSMDEGDWMYMPTTMPGISIGKARQLLQQTDKLIKSVPEVRQVFGKIGRAETATDPAPLTMVETVIRFKDRSQWRPGMTPEKLKKELDRTVKLPGVTNAWVMPIKTRIDMLATGIKTPVGIKISGPDLNTIQALGKKIENTLAELPGTVSVYADRVVGGRYVNIDINRFAASRFGLNVLDIQNMVSSAIGGVNLSETIEGRERYPINMRYPQHDRNSVAQLELLPIITKQGKHIPLNEVASISIADGPPAIKSENAQLVGWVLVDIADIDVGTYIRNAKLAIAQKIKWPGGYTLTWSGQYEYMERAKSRLKIVAPLTVFIIFMLLYFNSASIVESLIMLMTLPLALTGGVWLFYMLGYYLSIAAGVGFIALAGVAVELGVVMLAYLNQSLDAAMAQKNNIKPTQAELKDIILSSALSRIRPIIMAGGATIAALLPIMYGHGTGSEVMRRIAAPVVGGMVTVLLLTLFVIPAAFYVWKKR